MTRSYYSFYLVILSFFLASCVSGDAQNANEKVVRKPFSLPVISQQVILGITDDWNNSGVTLQLFELKGSQWVATTERWKGRLGRNGSSWGIGLHPAQNGIAKKEGDGRTPAGIFALGGAMGYDSTVQKNPKQAYRQITTRDLWVEDTKSPHYNKHLILDHEPTTEWEKKAQMRQGDHAHSLKLFIKHNTGDQTVAGKGSSIFFHIWRGGGSKPTAGCTTMSESALRSMIAKVDPSKSPTYVLLPKAEYNQFKSIWKLP